MQNGDMVIFFLRVFRKVRFRKNAVSGRWCLDSNYFFPELVFFTVENQLFCGNRNID